MARLVFLDSGPLGLASQASGKTQADRCRAWIRTIQASGTDVYLPEIARYEVRRELVRAGASAGLKRLDNLRRQLIYLPLVTAAIDRAAELWAFVRNAGLPTAAPDALDADAILTAQALTAAPGDVIIIATTNAIHLSRFPGLAAQAWETIA